jgi:hypothetical protein
MPVFKTMIIIVFRLLVFAHNSQVNGIDCWQL